MEHSVDRRIGWGDLDALGIVFYPRYYEWIDAASHLFFEAAGLDLNRLLSRRGLTFGLVETGCRYRRPGRYHQRIRVVTAIETLGRRTIALRHTIRGAEDGATMVEGREKRICMQPAADGSLRAAEIPADIREVLEAAKR